MELKRSNQPGLVDELLDTIRRFEQGWEQSLVLKDTNRRYFKVRKGDFRIIFEKQNEGYVLWSVRDRKEGYADVVNYFSGIPLRLHTGKKNPDESYLSQKYIVRPSKP